MLEKYFDLDIEVFLVFKGVVQSYSTELFSTIVSKTFSVSSWELIVVHKIELSLNLAASVHSELLQTLLKRGTLPLPGIHMQSVFPQWGTQISVEVTQYRNLSISSS